MPLYFCALLPRNLVAYSFCPYLSFSLFLVLILRLFIRWLGLGLEVIVVHTETVAACVAAEIAYILPGVSPQMLE